MKTKKLIVILLGILIGLTAILAVVHSVTRDKVPEGALLIQYNGKDSYVSLDKLSLTEVRGTILNGKGEEKEVQAQGVSIPELLKAAGIDGAQIQAVSAVADDEFSAELSADEINEDGRAFLAKDEDGSMKLIVFGDSDSKRNVRSVVKLIVR